MLFTLDLMDAATRLWRQLIGDPRRGLSVAEFEDYVAILAASNDRLDAVAMRTARFDAGRA